MTKAYLAGLLLAIFAAPAVRAQSADTTDTSLRGFAALEQHRTSGDLAHASDAARAFATALRENPNDPVAHYGLAATLFNARKTMTIVRQFGVAHGEALHAAKRSLEKALELKPNYGDAARLLLQVAEQAGDQKALERALAAMPAAAPAAAPTAKAAVEKAPVTAADYVRRAAELYARGENVAAYNAYRAGLELWDRAGADAYVYDILVTADKQEVISLTDGDPAKRRAALERFWQKRAVRGGISVPDRIAEHYRRLDGARTRYPLPREEGRHLPLNVYGKERTGLERELDDRGLIFVRYGEPTERIHGRDYQERIDMRSHELGHEAWAYRDPDGRYRIYHFFGGRLEADVLRGIARPTLDGSPTVSPDAMERLARLDSRYAFMAARLETIKNYRNMAALIPPENIEARRAIEARIADRYEDIRRQNLRMSERNRDMLFAAFDEDAAYPRFTRQLTMFHDFATFRGDGCTDVVYSVAAPTSGYNLSVAVADTFTWQTQSVDTLVLKGSAVGMYLRSTGVLCMEPDYNAYVRFTASIDSVTGATAGGNLMIPDYSGSRLMISDLLFGSDEDGPFVRGNARIAIVPPRQFKQNEPFRLFYEIYNLPAGARYKTTLTFETKESNPVVKLFKGSNKVTFSFEGETSTAGVAQEIRTLTPQIEDGEVELTVTVQAGTQTTTKKEKLWILPPDDS